MTGRAVSEMSHGHKPCSGRGVATARAAFLQAWGEFESLALGIVGEKPTEARRSGLPAGLSPGFVGGAEGSAHGVFPGQRVTRLV